MNKPDIKGPYKKRDNLLLLSRRYPTMENKEKLQTIQRSKFKRPKKKLSEFITSINLSLIKKDIKKSWKIIRNMIVKEDSGCSKYQIYFLINGQYSSNSNTITNSFNNYLANVGN